MNVRQEALTEQEWWHIIYCDRASWSKITVIDSQKWSFVTLCLCFRAHFKILQKGGGGSQERSVWVGLNECEDTTRTAAMSRGASQERRRMADESWCAHTNTPKRLTDGRVRTYTLSETHAGCIPNLHFCFDRSSFTTARGYQHQHTSPHAHTHSAPSYQLSLHTFLLLFSEIAASLFTSPGLFSSLSLTQTGPPSQSNKINK